MAIRSLLACQSAAAADPQALEISAVRRQHISGRYVKTRVRALIIRLAQKFTAQNGTKRTIPELEWSRYPNESQLSPISNSLATDQSFTCEGRKTATGRKLPSDADTATVRNQRPKAAAHLSLSTLSRSENKNVFTAAYGHQANRCTTDFLDYRDDFDCQGPLWAVANRWCHSVCLAALNP